MILPRKASWTVWIGALLIAAGVALAYRHCLHAPFIFDDILGIERNPTIRKLWPLGPVLHPPEDASVSGRPIANLSFALSNAIGGGSVESYRLGNIAIHLGAALLLFGVLRRTFAGRLQLAEPTLLALAIAMIWAVHPLQTESVTYLIQRLESLVGLFYLLTLYAFIRGAEWGPRSNAWLALSVAACLLGMGTKEVMASAPVMVLLYDRTFVAGTFLGAWRRRWGYYLALGSTWILVAALVLATNNRNGTAGFGIEVRWRDYVLTQFPAVVRYLQLAFWPRGQIFDYGTLWVRNLAAVWQQALAVAILAAATAYAFFRREREMGLRALGYAGVFFFAILSPTSLVPGNRQTIAEHRMYLALAPVLGAALVLYHRALTRVFGRSGSALLAASVFAVAAIGISLTQHRNATYTNELALWEDTVAKNPVNPYARNNLGNLYLSLNRVHEAVDEYETSVALKPDYSEAHNNLGTAYSRLGRADDAIAQYRLAIALKRKYYPDAHNNLAVALIEKHRVAEAIVEFREILKHQPDFPEAHFNLGNALVDGGQVDAGLAEYRRAMALGLDGSALHNNLGNALMAAGRYAEAEKEYVAALQRRPDYPEAYENLGAALLREGRPQMAIQDFEQAIRLLPGFVQAELNLANAYTLADRPDDAEVQYRAVLRANPLMGAAHYDFALFLQRRGRPLEAQVHFEDAAKLGFKR